MLFATQNPPGLYGGRKVLSRAFRNRFLEIHFDDIPDAELQEILVSRCQLPPKWADRLVAIMKDLQRHRQSSRVFAGMTSSPRPTPSVASVSPCGLSNVYPSTKTNSGPR